MKGTVKSLKRTNEAFGGCNVSPKVNYMVRGLALQPNEFSNDHWISWKWRFYPFKP